MDFSDFEALLGGEPVGELDGEEAGEAEEGEEELFGLPSGGAELEVDEFGPEEFGAEESAPGGGEESFEELPEAAEFPDVEEDEPEELGELDAIELTDEEFAAGQEFAGEEEFGDDSFSFEAPAVPGVDEPEAPGPAAEEEEAVSGDLDDIDTSDIDEFSLGDLGEDYLGAGQEPGETEEELNPAASVAELAVSMPGLTAELRITNEEFAALQRTLSALPLNVRIEVEGIIAEAKGTVAEVETLVRRLVAGESAADIAAYAGRVLGKQVRVPRGYEKRSGLAFEQERQSFAYQFRENVLPVLRLAAVVVVAVGLLALAGYHLVFRPLYARSLYREGLALIREDQYSLGNQSFERARGVWPADRWFYDYADAFVAERQYTLAREKYDQLLFGMSAAERELHNDLLDSGQYAAVVERRSPPKKGILAYAYLESELLGNYARADRLLQLVLYDDIADYDARLAMGDNFMRWAETRPERYEDARVAYARLIERFGQTDELLFRMLTYFIRTDNLTEVLAIKDLFQADRRLDIDPPRYAELGGYLIDNNLLADVEAVLFRTLDTDPTIPETHYHLARYYREISAFGEEEQALTWARRLFEQNRPLSGKRTGMLVDTITRIGENYHAADRYLEAQELYSEAIEVYEEGLRRRLLEPQPRYGRAYNHLADILYYIGRQYEDALAFYDAAERNGYDEPNLDYKQGFVHYRSGRLEQALTEFRQAAEDPSGSTNALLWATGNTYFRRGNFFAAEAYLRELLERVELQRDRIRTLLIDEDPSHQSVIEYLIRVNNNLGVTLNRLHATTGDQNQYSLALVHLTESIEYAENYRRDPETLAGSDAVSLAYLNQRGILYPTPAYTLQIYNEIPEDLDDLVF